MDKEYWDQYYITQQRSNPSQFANFIIDRYPTYRRKILDLGCGDGRDSICFYESGMIVHSIDQSVPKSYIDNYKNRIRIIKADFTTYRFESYYNYIFARFVFHAIDNYEETALLNNISKHLCIGGYLFIEARSINNELCQKYCNNNLTLFKDNHNRRFIEPEKLVEKLKQQGFKIELILESNDFSPTEFDNQTFLRIVAVRMLNNGD